MAVPEAHHAAAATPAAHPSPPVSPEATPPAEESEAAEAAAEAEAAANAKPASNTPTPTRSPQRNNLRGLLRVPPQKTYTHPLDTPHTSATINARGRPQHPVTPNGNRPPTRRRCGA